MVQDRMSVSINKMLSYRRETTLQDIIGLSSTTVI